MVVETQLERIREIQLEIDELWEYIKTMRSKATSITQVLSNMPKARNNNKSKTENAAINLLLKCVRLEENINQLTLVRDLAEADIMRMITNKSMQTVLKARYIYNYSWKKIEKMMKLSKSQVYRLKCNALDILEKIFTDGAKWN